jgi:NADH pyrophosphatase NudC (nudix superfamily)
MRDNLTPMDSRTGTRASRLAHSTLKATGGQDLVNSSKIAIASRGASVMSEFHFCPRCAAPLGERKVQGEVRSACSANCGFVHYDNPTPVVAAVVEHNGMVVLAHNRAWPQTFRSFYGLITGFLERGESAEQCALREVKEELDLAGTGATLIGVYPFEQMNQVIIAYHVPANGTVALNHELDDFRHVRPGECKAWAGGTGLALRDWLRSKGFEPPMLELGEKTASE